MYSAFGLLTPDSDFTMTEAAKRLSAKLPSFAVKQVADTIGFLRGLGNPPDLE